MLSNSRISFSIIFSIAFRPCMGWEFLVKIRVVLSEEIEESF
jgi:hypothetical protein